MAFIHIDTNIQTIHHTQTLWRRRIWSSPHTVMWTFIISKITSIRHLKPFGEIPFIMMITRWWRIILHNPLLTPDVLKLGKSVPVPVAEFSISFISFWDNHLFVYSDEHYRWCSKFCINRNKIDLASVRGGESGESLEHWSKIAWSQLGGQLWRGGGENIISLLWGDDGTCPVSLHCPRPGLT